MPYSVRVLSAEFGIPRATVIVTNGQGLNRSYKIPLRDWNAPDGEHFFLLGEYPEIQDSDARYAVNMALLEFQDYNPHFRNWPC